MFKSQYFAIYINSLFYTIWSIFAKLVTYGGNCITKMSMAILPYVTISTLFKLTMYSLEHSIVRNSKYNRNRKQIASIALYLGGAQLFTNGLS